MSLLPPPVPPVKMGLQRIGVYFTPWAAALAVGILLYSSDTHRGPPRPPTSSPIDGALPLQQWATDTVPHFISSSITGALPAPDPRQRKPPCDPDMERAIEGSCWIPVDVKPCPKGKAWEHEGQCYARALNAARLPSSGEFRPSNVAGEPQ